MFIFGGNTGKTYEQLKRDQRTANAMLYNSMQGDKSIGSGLASIGAAIAKAMIDKEYSAKEKEELKKFDEGFGQLIGGGYGKTPEGIPQPEQNIPQQQYQPIQQTQLPPIQQPKENFGNVLQEAVKMAESRGNMNAVSPKGAISDMQVMPATNRDPGFGVQPAKDSTLQEASRVGKDYLRVMREKFKDDTTALIAYNWGPGRTEQWLKEGADWDRLPKETRDYVVSVNDYKSKMQPEPQNNEGDMVDNSSVTPPPQVLSMPQPQAPQQQMQVQQQAQENKPLIDPRLLSLYSSPVATPTQKAIMSMMIKNSIETNAPPSELDQLRVDQIRKELSGQMSPMDQVNYDIKKLDLQEKFLKSKGVLTPQEKIALDNLELQKKKYQYEVDNPDRNIVNDSFGLPVYEDTKERVLPNDKPILKNSQGLSVYQDGTPVIDGDSAKPDTFVDNTGILRNVRTGEQILPTEKPFRKDAYGVDRYLDGTPVIKDAKPKSEYKLMKQPDGSQVMVVNNGDGVWRPADIPLGGTEATPIKKLTEQQSKMANYIATTKSFGKRMEELEQKAGFDANSLRNKLSQEVGIAGNYLATEGAQLYLSNAYNWLDSVLRLRSGAAVTHSERKELQKSLIPQAGDYPATIIEKKNARRVFYQGMLAGAGHPIDVLDMATGSGSETGKEFSYNTNEKTDTSKQNIDLSKAPTGDLLKQLQGQ